MAEEVKTGPTTTYRKMSQSGQRVKRVAPMCSILFPDPDRGKVLCKGEIHQGRCTKCGTWYGSGPDPLQSQRSG